jgi:hypothetical protein
LLKRTAEMQRQLTKTIRQYARPGRERALLEMFSVVTAGVANRDLLLLELRERLNNSPY